MNTEQVWTVAVLKQTLFQKDAESLDLVLA